MRFAKLFVLCAALALAATGPAWAQEIATDRCQQFCFDGLEVALARCATLPTEDQDACIDRSLTPFGACVMPCVQGGKMTVFRLPDGRAQLVVHPAGTSATFRTRSLDRRRVPVLTVPFLRGVDLRSGVFPDFATLSQYVMRAYEAASDRDNRSRNGCARPDGCSFSGPPRIFILLPSSGPGFMPVGVGGTNYDAGTVPFVNSVPSVALFNWGVRNLPLIGSVAVGFTIVPPAAPSGPGDVSIEYNGGRSNPFPFTKN